MVACITCISITGLGFAQSDFKKVHAYLDSLTIQQQFSGFVLVAKKGKPVFQKDYGYADKDLKTPNTISTQFCLSSTSKLFTGTAIVKLMQEGKVSENDTIGTYINGLTYGSKITIRQLLTHTSGLGDFYENPGFTFWGVKKCSDVVRFIADQQLKFTPGEGVKYSTSGMILLGAVIEEVSGLSFQQYLTETFFVPLKMNHTTFVTYNYVQYQPMEPSSYAIGYIKDSEGNIIIRKQPWDNPSEVVLSAGGIWSSAEDLLKFNNAVFGGKILNKKFLQLMITSKVHAEWPDTDFGYVWMNIHNNQPTHAVGHAGNAGGHHNTFYRYDKNATTIILLTNYGFVDIFKISAEVEKNVIK